MTRPALGSVAGVVGAAEIADLAQVVDLAATLFDLALQSVEVAQQHLGVVVGLGCSMLWSCTFMGAAPSSHCELHTTMYIM
jgi:hypothetical protein